MKEKSFLQRATAGIMSVCLLASCFMPFAASAEDATPNITTDVVIDSNAGRDESISTPEEAATPEQAETEPKFIEVVSNADDSVQYAQPGDTVNFSVELNRDDVAVTYQWMVRQKQVTVPDDMAHLAQYDYSTGCPTWYSYLWDDTPEYEMRAQYPDYGQQ